MVSPIFISAELLRLQSESIMLNDAILLTIDCCICTVIYSTNQGIEIECPARIKVRFGLIKGTCEHMHICTYSNTLLGGNGIVILFGMQCFSTARKDFPNTCFLVICTVTIRSMQNQCQPKQEIKISKGLYVSVIFLHNIRQWPTRTIIGVRGMQQ